MRETFPDVPVRLRSWEVFVFRAPIAVPVQTSFGLMTSRPAVLIRVEDESGAIGWGEVWCNFPSVGAEHRAQLFASCVGPVLLGDAWRHPSAVYERLTAELAVLAIQSGEYGPIAQVLAGTDMALWDLFARRVNRPLWELLGGDPEVQIYASGLNPTHPEKLAAAKLAEGYRAFKVKVGFGRERDLQNLQSVRDVIGGESLLMADANQAWSLQEAAAMARAIAPFQLHWLEEPITADHSWPQWRTLADASAIPLAAGENFRGDDFDRALESGALTYIQPDIGKWGGFSGCAAVARRIIARDRIFCPHWLGAGVGLAASLQLKAGVGGVGMVEVDANPNPLCQRMGSPVSNVQAGMIRLSGDPGLGYIPDLAAAEEFLVLRLGSRQ